MQKFVRTHKMTPGVIFYVEYRKKWNIQRKSIFILVRKLIFYQYRTQCVAQCTWNKVLSRKLITLYKHQKGKCSTFPQFFGSFSVPSTPTLNTMLVDGNNLKSVKLNLSLVRSNYSASLLYQKLSITNCYYTL